MLSASIRDHTGRGYTPPTNIQFSVFLDNRVGKLLELLEVFGVDAPRVVGLCVMDSREYAVVRLLTSDSDRSRRLLDKRRLAYNETEVSAVRLDDGRGLADVCRCLLTAELSVDYAYPLMLPRQESPAIALHTDNRFLACEILQRKGFTLLGEAEMQ